MDSHITGTLKSWNADRGFGFITPVNGGDDIFVHISDFPRQGGKPQIGETLLFAIALNREGKKKAVRVLRARNKPAGLPPAPLIRQVAERPEYVPGKPRPQAFGKLTGLLLLASIVFFGYQNLFPRNSVPSFASEMAPPIAVNSAPPTPASRAGKCDGRIHCSQMNSCAEAKFFLANCPDVQMDGDGDGIPCEQQWCRPVGK